MISIIEFETPIASSYYRNNRSTRQKSLRCFPSCGIRGHVVGGFCGLPLRVKVNFAYLSKQEIEIDQIFNSDLGQYVFMAEMRPSKEKKLSNEVSISRASLIEKIRTKFDNKANSEGEIFMAEVELIGGDKDSSNLILQFNSQQCSWDYSWKSNRWSGPSETHVIDIIALKKTGDDFLISSSCCSPPFVIVSSHKKYKRKEDEEIYENDQYNNNNDSENLFIKSKEEEICGEVCEIINKKKKARKVVTDDNVESLLYNQNEIFKVLDSFNGINSQSLIYEILGSYNNDNNRNDSDSFFGENSFPYDSEFEALNASANILVSLVRPNNYYYDIEQGRSRSNTCLELSENIDLSTSSSNKNNNNSNNNNADNDNNSLDNNSNSNNNNNQVLVHNMGIFSNNLTTQDMVELPLKHYPSHKSSMKQSYSTETTESFDMNSMVLMPVKY